MKRLSTLILASTFLTPCYATGPGSITILTDGTTPILGGANLSLLANVNGNLGHVPLPLSILDGGTGGGNSLTGLLLGNGTSAFSALTPGTGVQTALGQPVIGAGGILLANSGCKSALQFGFVGDGVTDNTSSWSNARSTITGSGCIYFPAGKYLTSTGETWTLPNSLASIKIEGDGQDASILYWPNASGGLNIAETNCANSFHVDSLTFTTGTVAGGTALNVVQSAASCEGTHYATNDIYRTTFRGDDGGNGTDYWNYGAALNGVWSTNFEGDTWYGPTAATGYGIYLLSADSNHVTAIVNVSKSIFLYEGIGIVYGSLVQGVTVSQTNFNADVTGIQSPAGLNSLAQLTVTNSQFNTTSIAINELSVIYNTVITGCEFIVASASDGINLGVTDEFQLIGNFFSGGSYGTVIGAGVGGTISDNIFYSEGLGLDFQSGANNNNAHDNTFLSNTATLINSGSSNIIRNNPGYNPVGTVSVTPSATSPWTYTAGASPETLYISGGTITAATQNSGYIIQTTTTTLVSIPLNPGDVLVTYFIGTLTARKFVN